MKKYILAMILLILLPLAVTILALPVLPDSVPAHYNAFGEVDRWGSKYELFIFPGINVLFAATMAFVTHFAAKQEAEGKNNARICGLTTILCLVMFDVMALYFLWTAMAQTGNLNDLPIEINQLLMILLGAMLVILGNVMPKTRRNSMLGLRMDFSMKNDNAWKISQRVGGAGLMITGVVMIVIGLVTRGMLCMGLGLAVLAIGATVAVIMAANAAAKAE